MEDNLVKVSLLKFSRKYVEALKELDNLDNFNKDNKDNKINLEIFILTNRMEINYLMENYKECSLIGIRYINKDDFFRNNNELYLSVFELTANSLVIIEEIENLSKLLKKTTEKKEIPEIKKLLTQYSTLTKTVEKKEEEEKKEKEKKNKKEKNWDKIIDDEEKKAIKNKEVDGDPTMKFFQEIYANADDETKRAMMKSFSTSNGQVLSTNWGEVKNKDYEGKDKLDAPKGMKYTK